MVPHDTGCKVESIQGRKKPNLALVGPWWPALDMSLLLLLQGKIKVLRLEYPEKYRRGKGDDGIETDYSERFKAIRRLRSKCQGSPSWDFAVKWTSNVDGDDATVLELTKIVSGKVAGSGQ